MDDVGLKTLQGLQSQLSVRFRDVLHERFVAIISVVSEANAAPSVLKLVANNLSDVDSHLERNE